MSPAGASSPTWLDSKLLVLFIIAASIVPLLLPAVPPLIDLPGHIARYRVELDLHQSPYLKQWYDFRWALFGNLGVDLLVVPLTKLMPLELAVKLIVISIPPATMIGMLYLAKEIHGRVPPTALFALPLAYSFPFQLGFVNFTLSMALAFLFAGLWLNLGRIGRIWLRGALFAVLSMALFLAHCVGWAIFGVILFSAEIMGRREQSQGWRQALYGTITALLPLATPAVLILNWAGHGPGGVTMSSSLVFKLAQLTEVLRDRIRIFDVLSVVLLEALIICGVRRIGVRYDPRLAVAAVMLGIAYLATPTLLKGVFYADIRMLPYVFAVALLGLAPVSTARTWTTAFVFAGLAFFASRMATQFITYQDTDRSYGEQLAALDHIDRGSRVFVQVYTPCDSWDWQRMSHLGSLATARREAFTNGMWPMPGGRLLTITYKAAEPFQYSPSQVLEPARCRSNSTIGFSETLAELPRHAFDYVWLIDLPADKWPNRPWLKPVWHTERGVLYRILATR